MKCLCLPKLIVIMFSTSSSTKGLKKPLSIIIDHNNYKAHNTFKTPN